jgi:hypothetical protein
MFCHGISYTTITRSSFLSRPSGGTNSPDVALEDFGLRTIRIVLTRNYIISRWSLYGSGSLLVVLYKFTLLIGPAPVDVIIFCPKV